MQHMQLFHYQLLEREEVEIFNIRAVISKVDYGIDSDFCEQITHHHLSCFMDKQAVISWSHFKVLYRV